MSVARSEEEEPAILSGIHAGGIAAQNAEKHRVQTTAHAHINRSRIVLADMFHRAKSREVTYVALLRSARNRGDQQYFIAFLEGVRLSAEETDVFLVHINIQEAADLALVVAQVRLQVGKLLVKDGEQLSQVRCRAGDRSNSFGVAPQCGRNLYGDRHTYAPTAVASAMTPGISDGLSDRCR